MCLGVPAKVISVSGQTATVDFGGVRRDVLVGIEAISPGQLVVIHAGVAIGSMSADDVMANVVIYRDIIEAELIGSGLDEAAAKGKATDEMNKLLRSLGIERSVDGLKLEDYLEKEE
ncbi:MAG: HypC/HybG/HupF family hydrogenase formation chaperone [Methanobacteriota archaeon]